MKLPLGKILRFLLDRFKGKIIKVGPVDIELSKGHGPDLPPQR